MDLIIRFLLLGVLSVAAQDDIQEILKDLFGTPPPLPDTNETCILKSGGEGRCMPINLCGDTSSSKVVPIEVHKECKHYMDICCSAIKEDDENNPVITDANHEADVSCGKHNPNGIQMSTVVDNDSEAKFAEFPWIAAVFVMKQRKLRRVYMGAGSIIHPEVVLTAAHITGGVMSVRAGEWDSMSSKELFDHQDIDVGEIVVHELYTPHRKNMQYDIAMLILSSPLMLTVHVGVVCLPPPGTATTPAGTRCLATGWGKDKFQNGQYQNILKKIELPVVDRRHCENLLRRTRLTYRYKLHSSFMCAGGKADKDTCVGDGGAPLVCPIPEQNDRYVQNGIVSWGIGCGKEGLPGVYIDLTFLRPWIDFQMTARNFNTSSYTYKIIGKNNP
ncbi:phenoloxidase-activating factor 2-like [Pieris brassicae]|uniref:phenoloxidase-activating factor 2-like n=1 Tax=Pieris brassicae TaxID=7116 RepID=UPI001E65F3F2|nr:phenoloxidase-activating factor 2-like [Pieris brassicae]